MSRQIWSYKIGRLSELYVASLRMRIRRRLFLYTASAVILLTMYSKLILLFGGISSLAYGQASSTSANSASPSPSYGAGVAVAGDYSGMLRPRLHYSPPSGFMNDPNGMFVGDDGVWHLYYQYNPGDTISGDQHWYVGDNCG